MTDVTEVLDSETFMERVFNADSAEVSVGLVAAGLKAHDWSLAAQHGSGRSTGEPYGATFWKALPDEVGKLLCDLLDGARMYRPRGAQYSLILWGGTLILPVKIKPRGKRDPRPRITTSHVRQTLTRVNMPDAPQTDLFISDEEQALRDFEEAAIAVVEKAKFELGNIVSQVIIVVYECNRHGGLQMVEVGIGNLDGDGYIEFTDSERLSLVAAPAEGIKPVEAVGESWHNVPRPAAKLEALDDNVAATGENGPVGEQIDSASPSNPKAE